MKEITGVKFYVIAGQGQPKEVTLIFNDRKKAGEAFMAISEATNLHAEKEMSLIDKDGEKIF